jgi:hypothetical protein
MQTCLLGRRIAEAAGISLDEKRVRFLVPLQCADVAHEENRKRQPK